MNFSKEERLFMALYSPGSKSGLIAALEEMKAQLAPDETDLAELTDKVLSKLEKVSEDAFSRLDLYNF